MINFITAYWDSILLVVLVIAGCGVAIRVGYKKQVKQMLLYLVTKAEKEFGGGTGQIKFAAVVSWIYERLPAIARLFLTADTIGKLIETAVTKMKEYLAANNEAAKLVEGEIKVSIAE